MGKREGNEKGAVYVMLKVLLGWCGCFVGVLIFVSGPWYPVKLFDLSLLVANAATVAAVLVVVDF